VLPVAVEVTSMSFVALVVVLAIACGKYSSACGLSLTSNIISVLQLVSVATLSESTRAAGAKSDSLC